MDYFVCNHKLDFKKIVDMCPHLIEIRVTERKVTGDPARLKKTSKTKNPKPKNLEKVHPAHDLNWTLLLFFWFHDYCYLFCNFLTTVACYLVTVNLLLCVCLLRVSCTLVCSTFISER